MKKGLFFFFEEEEEEGRKQCAILRRVFLGHAPTLILSHKPYLTAQLQSMHTIITLLAYLDKRSVKPSSSSDIPDSATYWKGASCLVHYIKRWTVDLLET